MTLASPSEQSVSAAARADVSTATDPTSAPDFRRAFTAISGVVFALSFLKGCRLPYAWTATHFGLNYSQGFVRRGLVGEVARQIAGDAVYKYNVFVAFAFAIFVLMAVALGWTIREALRADATDLGFKAALLTFAASPGLVFFVNTVGYHDVLGLLIALIVIGATARSHRRFAIFYLVLGVGLLFAFIHEVLVVLFGPLLVFAMACNALRLDQRGRVRRSEWPALFANGLVAAAFMFGLSVVVSTLGAEDGPRIQALQATITERADYAPRLDVFPALVRSSRESMRTLMPWFWSREQFVALAIRGWAAFVPGFSWLIYYGWRAIGRPALTPRARWTLRILFVGASLTPLLLNFVGFDWNRWNAAALISCFGCILTLKLFLPPAAPEPMPTHVWALGTIFTAVGLASTTPLFDGSVQFFPFDAQWEFLRDWFEAGFGYRPRS